MTKHVTSSDIRSAFSAAMSAMYRNEVPAYGTLMDLVGHVNAEALAGQPQLKARLEATDNLERISEERHGAIRLGTADELAMIRRVFAVMGMYPVGYYDLSTAGVPVHSTAFRPVGDEALKRNPFRVFTSLLRLDLIADQGLREDAACVLEKRQIFTSGALELTEKAEKERGLSKEDADRFVVEVLETFRWHNRAIVDGDMYHRLHEAHRLIADVVSFKGPHINHLTPRTLDIDRVQALMPDHDIAPKATIEGPPTRNCAILLRQTSFKALEEAVSFEDGNGGWQTGSHTARFGEIEQRGIALTPKGRSLYDKLLAASRKMVHPAADGSNAKAYEAALIETFQAFPDDWTTIRVEGLGYFTYSLTEKGSETSISATADVDALIADGLVQFDPIVYEDFLPVSAAGIFQSNLGDGAQQQFAASPNQQRFEADLGAKVLNEFGHYADIEQSSLEACIHALTRSPAAD
ncbi:2-oxoadipate dioxygenase/decarboxylase HglS [Rhizobium laguerreae]|uniref:2-oxoadipate dioxygenase/decarboxylase HglS n=1 Tax=Rhizobium laguerreae TaxID=1076926 RepID=UPI001C91BAA5|nr:VOC family protein [Rhizobium laguerreae]MBY3348401.1 VOC family protein [Rhizobium laguerreae]MBY3355418.1 VOC family protein [Rhizobium laguerreae]MBY3369267.1 VOC family protein [Rhizobium laguerreae]MBY3376555.1 VOC family protein [Rhizobium laguerreae]MBY3390587.1 VOC family protein [Rhizobium laguerreae]